jgi:hypothetical protein
LVEGQALTTLAAAALADGDPALTTSRASEALAIHRETGYVLGAARATHLLSAAHRTAGGVVDPNWPAALARLTATDAGQDGPDPEA